jgi:hypothetical protein
MIQAGHVAMELDIEYTNGWRETITLQPGEDTTLPFEGKIVGARPVFQEEEDR